MALTETPPDTTESPASEPSEPVAPIRTEPTLVERLVGSGEHQLIGRMFVAFSLVFGSASLVILGLADIDTASKGKIFSADVAARLSANGQLGVLLCGILPLLVGIAICVVPRQIGSPAIAFHRAASAALWGWLGSSVLFIVAVAANGSYFGTDAKAVRLGNLATGGLMVSLMLASVCVAVTVLNLRPMGLTLDRVPFFSFSMLVAATVWVLTLPAGLAYIIMGQIAHSTPETFADTTWRGLSFLLLQPAIYAVFIPVLGIVLDVVATAVGGRQRFRGMQLVMIGSFGLFSYGAWAQGHVGQSNLIWAGFSLAVFLPIIGVLGGAADTLRSGRPKFMAPLAFAVLVLPVALLAVADGALQVINTAGKGYVGHFTGPDLASGQFRLIVGAAIVGALGGVVYWSRQIFGASLADVAGKALVVPAALAAVLWGVPLVVAGLVGGDAVRPMYGLAGAGALLTGLVMVATLGGGLAALRTSLRGDVVGADPWGGGGTLEWTDLDQPTVTSAYPALDLAEGGAS